MNARFPNKYHILGHKTPSLILNLKKGYKDDVSIYKLYKKKSLRNT